MTISTGQRVPEVTVHELTAEGPKPVTTTSLMAGRKVAVFGLPGAFTRTCSSKHLPGFVQHAAALKAKGIQDILCVSVNDAFVMDAWGRDHNASGSVRMIGDGNADLAKALGVDRDASGNGMGTRSKRYSMIVDDGVVTAFNLEPDGQYGASSAEHMLDQV